LKLVFPFDPVPKGRPRFNGHAYTPKRTRDAEKAIREYASLIWKGEAIDKPIVVNFTFRFKVSKSWAKSKKEKALSGELKHVSRPDRDNLEKMVSDALNGIVWVDDSQIYDGRSRKEYAEHGEIVVEIGEEDGRENGTGSA
tara:strand:+ start:30124 stop:30546 length:423 start_codon:yes stop_codon:yes gene_type:complete